MDSLDLYIATTDLHGRGETFPTYDGGVVYAKTHRRPFPFHYRLGGDNDFQSSPVPLWQVCRASSAFPFAFPPAPVKDAAGSQRFLSDGGILQNFPFDPIVDAIATRPADVFVDRALFYVEPDPGFDEAAYHQLQGDQERLPVDSVVAKALFGIPAYESIAESLQRLRGHNDRVGVYRQSAELLEQWFDQTYAARGQTEGSKLAPTEYERFKADPASQTYRAWKRVAVFRRTTAWLLDLEPHLDGRKIRDELERLERADAAAFYRAFDSEFRVRRFYYLTHELVRAIKEVSEVSTRQGKGQAFAAFTLGVESRPLLERLLANKAAILRLALDSRGAPGKAAGNIQPSGEHPRLTNEMLGAFLERAQGLLSTDFARIGEDGERTTREVDNALREGGHPALARFQVMSDSFELRDAYLFPLTFAVGIGERDYVELVPVSPSAATHIRVTQKRKLAGETVNHFGGFLKQEWRRNDIMWGRLDAAETIVRFLLPRIPESNRKPLETYLEPIQARIVDENPLTRDRGGLDYKTYLESRYNVGDEGLGNVPPKDLVPLALQTTAVVHGIVRELQRQRAKSPVAGAVYGLAARAMGLLNTVANPVASLVFPRNNIVKAAVALLMLLAVGWAAGVLAVHFANFQRLNTSTVLLAALMVATPLNLAGFYYRLTWKRFLVLAVLLLLLLGAAVVDVRYATVINRNVPSL